ncbi:gastrin-releasing peptide [Tachysurus fulvidraco]|uniref:gastrin-releasing peptide n=1 Tax=Tachysurus fulvidraco TaxID=1234273 RepID=UPI001FEFEE78|nr:gastrin-releasing peptide [Tachysurus fulvidraco]
MCVLWRYRLVVWVSAVLLCFLLCDAQLHNEAQSGKLVFARGNHWAVGHLMGKKSIDETMSSDDRDLDAQAYLIRAEADTLTQPSRLLKALVKVLSGSKRDTEDERERWERSMELKTRPEEQLERQRGVNQAAKFLLLALNTRDSDTS